MRVVISLLLGLGLAIGAASGAAAADTGKAASSQVRAEQPFAARLDRSHAGSLAPAVKFVMRDGGSASVADFKGKPVLVNLWATWCVPCIAELPDLDQFVAGGTRGVTVLAISQDAGGWRAVDRFWTPDLFKHLVPRLDARASFAQAIGTGGLPVSILYDARGRERWRVNGSVRWTSPEVAAALR